MGHTGPIRNENRGQRSSLAEMANKSDGIFPRHVMIKYGQVHSRASRQMSPMPHPILHCHAYPYQKCVSLAAPSSSTRRQDVGPCTPPPSIKSLICQIQSVPARDGRHPGPKAALRTPIRERGCFSLMSEPFSVGYFY